MSLPIPRLDDLPAAIRAMPWVAWRNEDGRKIPYNARNGKRASSTNADDWTTAETAIKFARARSMGVGVVFVEGAGLVGLDIDDCIDDAGEIAPWAAELLDVIGPTYVELSPSQRGVKAWLRGALPADLPRRYDAPGGGIEVYDKGRYFTVTGWRMDGAVDELADADALVAYLRDLAAEPAQPTTGTRQTARSDRSDTREERYAAAALDARCRALRMAREGTRNDTLYRSAVTLFRMALAGWIHGDRVTAELAAAAAAAGLRTAEVRATIASARRAAGELGPRDALADRPRPSRRASSDQRPAPIAESVGAVQPAVTLPRLVTARQLQTMEFPPPRWVIDELLPVGVTLLAARPKAGKSWLALQAAVAVASGGRFLGYYDVDAGDALYLDLEGSLRRMQGRLRSMALHGAWPDRLAIGDSWGAGDDALAQIDAWCEQTPNARLVVIDILARIRGAFEARMDRYDYDYRFLQQLNALAERRNIAVLVLHHTRKAKGDDVYDEISGSTGVFGAVSAAWMMTANPSVAGERLLHVRGRDIINDEPVAIRWNNDIAQHVRTADGPAASSSALSRAILAAIPADGAASVSDIMAATGAQRAVVDNYLSRMVADGVLTRPARGMYARLRPATTPIATDRAPAPTPTPIAPVAPSPAPAAVATTTINDVQAALPAGYSLYRCDIDGNARPDGTHVGIIDGAGRRHGWPVPPVPSMLSTLLAVARRLHRVAAD